MKKKVLAGIFAAALVFSIGATALAAEPQDPDCPGLCGAGVNYVDEDGDGVCDNFDAAVCGRGCGRGAGRRGGYGRGRGLRAAFVDEDGDGVCDNFDSAVCGGGYGRGRGLRAAFVDEDGDGVCDNFDSAVCGGGYGRGCHGGRRG